ncbi:MAG: hypothetical protein ACXVSE_13745 [Solirubrobacteraceae bacterium]
MGETGRGPLVIAFAVLVAHTHQPGDYHLESDAEVGPLPVSPGQEVPA